MATLYKNAPQATRRMTAVIRRQVGSGCCIKSGYGQRSKLRGRISGLTMGLLALHGLVLRFGGRGQFDMSLPGVHSE